MLSDPSFLCARAAVLSSRLPVIFSGAGMSAECGVPTFRGAEGLWEGFRPEELATPQAFSVRPQVVTDWYRWRRSLIAGVEPHPGHLAVANYCQQNRDSIVVTQNVDGLHQRSGCPEVVELHGSIWIDRCEGCGQETSVPQRCDSNVALEPIPKCDCGSLRRPGVVWFGEKLPSAALTRATLALSRADLILVVGTSAVVQPAAALVGIASSSATLIEVNPDPARQDTLHLVGTAGEILPELLREERRESRDRGPRN